ncbi:valyl-tRNA synthetase, mitochondrial isoform X1 [Lasioglossum baleicum]|uniref:valyl-tRNA synthetase, mitochondrial isoform X1 n=1 Tax=Lasioglossum baleicum TaxID=434251 RepID=UPI003FCE8080
MYLMRLNDCLRNNSYYKYCCNRFSTQSLSDFPPSFNPRNIKHDWHNTWEKNKYFTVTPSEKDALRMLLPPPNITGTLHLGHTLTITVQDILARWYRMKGHPVLWIPGLDHAGIATQMMVEKYLCKTKGMARSEIGREEFLSIVWEWKNQKETGIKSQLKALGASLDWSREYFTMSKDHNNAVIESFVRLNDRNLIYRKKDLVNWCPTLGSTISDVEVEHVFITEKTALEVPGHDKKVTFGVIAYIAYPVKDSEDEIVVATTRPESLFGDVAIAVHPNDERYAKYIGQTVWNSLRETYIPVVADSLVEKDFGTGAVKVTPAHDRTDYAIAKNHGLDIIEVFDEHGKITDAGKQFKGIPRFVAREKVLNELADKGLLRSVCDHKMVVPRCLRSQDIIEYVLKEQWFLKCKDMARKAIDAVKEGHLHIVPATHEQSWYDWLENIRDWCLSRQLWWGHRIPAYSITIGDKVEWIIARTESDARIIAQNTYGSGVKLSQDEDVLDTWFSSAILPFAVLGWPKQTTDFKSYYPLTLMETGHDILFFWVARMAMLGLELTDCLPFNKVLLHGILCDAYGKKMSKTLGNVISPENIINGATVKDLNEQMKESYNSGILSKKEFERMVSGNKKMFPNGIKECGADALRMTLCSHNVKNEKINFDMMECETNKFFCNKIWQASKYIILTTSGKQCQQPECLTVMDRWILSQLSATVEAVNDSFSQRDFHKAIISIKSFLYYRFCDFYLEATKWGFKTENSNVMQSHTYSLRTCLEVSLRLISPITPFFADELYTRLSNKFSEFLPVPSLMEAPYPMPQQFNTWKDDILDQRIQKVIDMILEIRSITAHVSKKMNPEVHIVACDPEDFHFYNEIIHLIKGGSKISNIYTSLKSNHDKEDKNGVYYCSSSQCVLFITAQVKLLYLYVMSFVICTTVCIYIRLFPGSFGFGESERKYR